MKKISKILYVLVFALAIFGMQSVALANEVALIDYAAQEEAYSFSQDESEVYLPFARFSTGNITIDKPVNNMGAIFSSSRVEINEAITKMSAIFSQDSIRVNANVSNSVLFAKNSIVIDGEIDGNVILFSASEITVSEDAVVNGDIFCFTGTLNVKGNVKGSVIGAATNVKVSGIIEKDLRVEAKDVKVENEKLVKGNMYIESDTLLENIKTLYPEAVIKINAKEEIKFDYFGKIKDFILTALVLTVLYVLLAKLQKKEFFKNQLNKVNKYKTPLILVGTLGFVALPVAVILLIVFAAIGLSAVAVPVLLVYITLIISAAMLGVFVAGSTIITIINDKYLKEKNIIYLMLTAFGTFLVLQLITMLPVVGIVFAMYALGVLTITLIKRN